MDVDDAPEAPFGIDPAASRRIFLGMLALVAGAALAYTWLRPRAGPPPAAIAHDPLLVQGREVFLDRCATCHGASGRGDGPIAKDLAGPPPGDLTDATWKHGGRPEEVEAVIARGVRETRMPAWGDVLSADQLRAVAAYTYYLAGQPVPKELRAR